MNYNESEILRKLGCNICAERNRARLSQEELAESLTISSKHLGKIERGLANPKFTTILAIVKALNITFDTLYKD